MRSDAVNSDNAGRKCLVWYRVTECGVDALDDLSCVWWRLAEHPQADVIICDGPDLSRVNLGALRPVFNSPFSHLWKQDVYASSEV